jgi:Na+/H+ antiporter NhaD/arsenite permease-like protein
MNQLLTDSVIIVAILGIAVGALPGLRMNRSAIALAGATALVAVGALTLTDAYKAIDLNTIALILSMMVINANLKLSGFFSLASARILTLARSPRQLLALVCAASGILSALFLNDTICLMLTPFVAELCLAAYLNPVPYLIAVATSANIGSMATIIGNPQNMLIGASSAIPFSSFAARLAVPALLGLAVAYMIIILSFRRDFPAKRFALHNRGSSACYRPLLVKCLLAIAGMIAACFLGAPIALASLAAASVLLVTRRVRSERVVREVDFSLLVFFASLFIITEAVKGTDAFKAAVAWALPAITKSPVLFVGFSTVFSNLISNVPTVLLFRPLIDAFADKQTAWLLLAMSSTLAGNLTLLGSVANLIVAEGAKKYGVEIRFGTYLRVGLPITVLTIAIGTGWLMLVR